MHQGDLYQACLATADEFFARKLWERFSNGDLLAFEVPGRELIAGSIMGAASEQFGLMLFEGATALEDFDAMLRNVPHRHAAWSSTMLCVSSEPSFDAVLETTERKGMTPLVFVKPPHARPEAPSTDQLEVLLRVLRALLRADAAGQLVPGDAGTLPLLRITGDLEEPEVRIDVLERASLPPARRFAEIAVPSDVAALPALSETYYVAFARAPIVADDVPGDVRTFVVVDSRGLVVDMKAMSGHDVAAAADRLFDVLRGKGALARAGRPAVIEFASEALHAALHRGLGATGIECSWSTSVPEVDAVLDGLEERIVDLEEHDPEADADVRFAAAVDPDPDPEDLAAWKAIGWALTERLAKSSARRALSSDKSWKRYFGKPLRETTFASPQREEMMMSAYLEWFVTVWRPTPRSRTAAERLLDGDLTPGERATLEARAAARPSFYRVASVDRGRSLRLVDVLTGEEIELTEKSLSETAFPGLVIVAKPFPVGAFHFTTIAGPPIAGFRCEPALEWLEKEVGLTVDGPIDPKASHLLGRLWDWDAEQDDLELVTVRNTDGDRLLWHTAYFDVDDVSVLAAALDERPDIERIEPGEWTWQRDDVGLGTLTTLGDAVLLEVNSRERFERAREWLERIPGVRFVRVSRRNVDPRVREDRPLDDRLPAPATAVSSVELPPETLAELQRIMERRYFAWLDEPVPALGNRTPRQACRTAEGRRKVERMIRTYADPIGTPGLTVPREAMLRELGLAGEGASGEA